MMAGNLRAVESAYAVRVRIPSEDGSLTRILTVLRECGEGLRAHLVCRLVDGHFAFCLCDSPTEAAMALRHAGFEADTQTVVTARVENRPAALSHLIRTIEAAGLSIEYSYTASTSDEAYLVARTDDNPRAEDALRNYLCLEDPGRPRSYGA
jgi:hypothetical protein